MLTKDEISRSILPIVTVIESNEVKTVSYRGTGFIIAPNTLVTSWSLVAENLGDERKYAVLVKTDSGYTTHFLTDIEQHPDGLDLAVAKVNIGASHFLRVYGKEALPGDEVITYGYSLYPEVNNSKKIAPSLLSRRFLRGSITRVSYYNKPGFIKTYAYEVDIPMLYGFYGAPLILPNSNEVAGVIFGTIEISKAEELSRDERVMVNMFEKGKAKITLGLAHHTDSLRSLLNITTVISRASVMPERFDSNIDREYGGTIVGLERSRGPINMHNSIESGRVMRSEQDKITGGYDARVDDFEKTTFDRVSGKRKGVLDTILDTTYKFAIFFFKEIGKALISIIHIRRQFDRIEEHRRAKEEKAKAAAMERLYRILANYEKRLSPEGLARLKEQRKIIEELQLEYPPNKNQIL